MPDEALQALELAQFLLDLRPRLLSLVLRHAREQRVQCPYRETSHRLLMKALAREGNTAEALRVYDDLRTRLRDDIGAAPSPETQEVQRLLLR